MGDNSHIGWTDATWPIVVGCDRVSPGCAPCYAIRDAWRMAHNPNPKISAVYDGLVAIQPNGQKDWTGLVRRLDERLSWPLAWSTPRRVFVPSLGDLFHDEVPDEFVDLVFGVMAITPHHTYQVLTKRAERMAAWVSRATHEGCVAALTARRPDLLDGGPRRRARVIEQIGAGWPWPLPNVWLGVSAERQREAEERIPWLLRAPAAVRFLSAEPLLGAIDLTRLALASGMVLDALEGRGYRPVTRAGVDVLAPERPWPARLDWVIAGGQSGGRPDAWLVAKCGGSPCPLHGERCSRGPGMDWAPKDNAQAWVRDLRDRCRAAGVAFFFKQWGGPNSAAGGRLLDGRTWDEFPRLAGAEVTA